MRTLFAYLVDIVHTWDPLLFARGGLPPLAPRHAGGVWTNTTKAPPRGGGWVRLGTSAQGAVPASKVEEVKGTSATPRGKPLQPAAAARAPGRRLEAALRGVTPPIRVRRSLRAGPLSSGLMEPRSRQRRRSAGKADRRGSQARRLRETALSWQLVGPPWPLRPGLSCGWDGLAASSAGGRPWGGDAAGRSAEGRRMERKGPPPSESSPPCSRIGRRRRRRATAPRGHGLALGGCRGGAAVAGGPPERCRPERRRQGEQLPT